MNLGIGLGVTNYLRVPTVALDPDAAIAALFESGEVGAWYDPSDSSTVFQDAAGTTPAGVGDPVGLILDKSQGLVLGSELVTNGAFDTDTTGWVAGGGAVLSASLGRIRVENGDTRYGFGMQAISTVVGKAYKATYEGFTNGTNFELRIGSGNSAFDLARINSPTSGQVIFTAVSSLTYLTLFNLTNTLGAYCEFDNISVRELPGNHATQTTSAARPVLQQSGDLYYLDFDGVDDGLSTTFASAQDQPNSIGVGFKYDVFTAKQYDFVYDTPAATAPGTPRHVLTDNNGTLLMYAGAIVNITAASLANTVYFNHYNTSTSSSRVDGAVAVSGQNVSTAQWGGIVLGADYTGTGRGMDGRIYSFVGVNRTLTAGEITDLETYLASKSGVTL